MTRMLILSGLLLSLLLFGCQQAEDPQPSQTEPASQEQAPTVGEAVKEETETLAERAREVRDDVVEETAEVAQKAKEQITEIVEEGKQALSQAMDEGQNAAVAAKEQIVAAAESAKASVDETVEKMTQTTNLEPVVFETAFGTVTMSHLDHVEITSCATCHGEGVPGELTLGKDAAHELCIDCHKQAGAGPTGCRDCHIR